MPRTKKIKDNPDLIKDTTSQAVINTNSNAYEARLNQIAKAKLDVQQSADIEDLKTDIAEIKKLLKNLVKLQLSIKDTKDEVLPPLDDDSMFG